MVVKLESTAVLCRAAIKTFIIAKIWTLLNGHKFSKEAVKIVHFKN